MDEFLYRVKTLTKEHLNNNFAYVCKNLLTGKAKKCHWRYRKSIDIIQWTEFCETLRSQFKGLKSVFDLIEMIRNRKIRSNDSFDSFNDSISSKADRLRHSISEEELVVILYTQFVN